MVMMERGSDRSKGFGFVEMGTADQAQAAIDGLHEQPLGGRNLIVNVARPREEGGGGNFRSSNNRGGYGGGNRY